VFVHALLLEGDDLSANHFFRKIKDLRTTPILADVDWGIVGPLWRSQALLRQAGPARGLQDHALSHCLRRLRRLSQRHRLTWREMMRIAEPWCPA
jgi:hypothetical protein